MDEDFPRWRRRKPVIRKLEFYVISAQDLRNVRHTGRMKTYVAAYIHSDKKVYTHTDEEGGTNPTWNEKLCLEVDERLLKADSGAQLNFDIYAHSYFRDKRVGGVTIMLPDAVRENSNSNLFPVTSHLIFTLDGDSQGILNICVPPGGRFPKRLDSLSFRNVLSDRGIQVEAVPSFKEEVEEEEEEEEELEIEAEAANDKDDDEDLGIYDESLFEDSIKPASKSASRGTNEKPNSKSAAANDKDDDEDLGIYDESFFEDSIKPASKPASRGANEESKPNSKSASGGTNSLFFGESRTASEPNSVGDDKSLLKDPQAVFAASGGTERNLPYRQHHQPPVNKDDDEDDPAVYDKSSFNKTIQSRRSW